MRLDSSITALLFSMIIISASCSSDCSYKIKSTYIESSCSFTEGFYFQELEVYSYKDGVPDSVEVRREISLSRIKEGLKPSNKIFFYDENKNYEWNDITNSGLEKTLPIKMDVDQWYRIRGLVFRGHPDRAAYIKLKKDGELEVHGYSESTFY
jgi:hypothetical protein